MTTTLEPVGVELGTGDGGVPARRAMVRWAWRLFRREWRQQLLVLALVTVAVAATVVGAATATNSPAPADQGFGSAQYMGTFQAGEPHLGAQIASLERRFGPVEVIENETLSIPGSVETFDLRAQNPRGRFGQPLLSLVSGRYPAGPAQVAVTAGVASAFNLHIGSTWRVEGMNRRVVGTVQNPESLLDEFALVVPGQIRTPSEVTVLFDAPPGTNPSSLGPNVQARLSDASANLFNPETIVVTLATVGMLLIALVAVGGFTVLAQRRLRSIGMIATVGATDKHIRLVVRANGAVVGIVGAVIGLVLGLVAWLVYRPHLEQSSHHLIGVFSLPWAVIGPAMVLAVAATFFAASRPGRAIARVPIVAALSGRPAPPKQVHRSAVPGVILLAVAAVLFTYAGRNNGNGGGMPELVFAFIALIAAVILLSPLCLAILSRFGRRAPVAVRLALRDLGRYRARAGSALAAISLGVLIAVVISVVAAGRYGQVLDYTGPNLSSNQLIVYTPSGPSAPTPSGHPIVRAGPGDKVVHTSTPNASQLENLSGTAAHIAASLGSHDIVTLESPDATLQHAAAGRNFSGGLYVATPSLLRAFGIKASQVNPNADILTMRPGLAGISHMQLVYGGYSGGKFVSAGGAPPGGGQETFPCPKGSCVANPTIQQLGALPSGTSAPNTVITEHAVHELHLQSSVSGWFVQTPQPLTASQIDGAKATAAGGGMSVETKSGSPSSDEVIDWATVFGVALALGILAMTVGLIRSETAGDLRTLVATGAGSSTRRTLTAATAGALALAGAVLGTAAGYVACISWFRSNPQNGGFAALASTPTANLLILLLGMPLLAAAAGWLFGGRQPAAMAHQPVE